MSHKLGFLEWMSYVKNVHQSNKPAMNRALERLTIYDFEKKYVSISRK
jgi:hypothetical protein